MRLSVVFMAAIPKCTWSSTERMLYAKYVIWHTLCGKAQASRGGESGETTRLIVASLFTVLEITTTTGAPPLRLDLPRPQAHHQPTAVSPTMPAKSAHPPAKVSRLEGGCVRVCMRVHTCVCVCVCSPDCVLVHALRAGVCASFCASIACSDLRANKSWLPPLVRGGGQPGWPKHCQPAIQLRDVPRVEPNRGVSRSPRWLGPFHVGNQNPR